VISWTVNQIVVEGSNLKLSRNSSEARKHSENISAGVTAELARRRDMLQPGSIGPWLQHLDDGSLRILLATRCLMNFGKLHLSDIDAIGVNSSGVVEMIEFKRKDPAEGPRNRIVPQPDARKAMAAHLDRIEQLKELDNDSVRKEFSSSTRWEKVKGKSFGLDVSHARNADLCVRAGIIYRYIVWNSDKRLPEELLSAEFKPLVLLDIRTAVVVPGLFDGISFTKGNDSGSYTSETRFQLMIPLDRFNSFMLT
jgi:hypothetical protein